LVTCANSRARGCAFDEGTPAPKLAGALQPDRFFDLPPTPAAQVPVNCRTSMRSHRTDRIGTLNGWAVLLRTVQDQIETWLELQHIQSNRDPIGTAPAKTGDVSRDDCVFGEALHHLQSFSL
jgi:hypothetical protein